MLEKTNKCLQKQKSQNLSDNILEKTDYAERKKKVAKYFSGRKGVRVWMGMDGRGSGVDTNIISNQASHPPSHLYWASATKRNNESIHASPFFEGNGCCSLKEIRCVTSMSSMCIVRSLKNPDWWKSAIIFTESLMVSFNRARSLDHSR